MSFLKIKKFLSNKDNFLYKLFLSPIIKVDNTKNYITIKVNIIYKNIKTRQFKYAIYIDNEDTTFVIQLEKWFKEGFFNKQDTLVIVRNFNLFSNEVIKYLENNGYNFYIYKIIKNLDISIFNIKYIFYIFNSFTNPIMIKNRNYIHIWIGHGESDKLASVNPMIKMYDYIFVAGEIAVKRLLSYNIINECDIKNNKIFKIGLPYIKRLNVQEKKLKKIKKILYAPTWEGVEKEQQYSSLKNNFGLNIVKKIKKKYNAELYFQPHPSTGIKDKRYIKYINKFINEFNNDITIIANKNSFIFNYIKHQNIINEIDYTKFDLVITDNSSMITNMIFYKLNYIVLLNKKLDLTKNFLLSISSIVNNEENLFYIIQNELNVNKTERYLKVIDDKYKSLDEIIKEMEKVLDEKNL